MDIVKDSYHHYTVSISTSVILCATFAMDHNDNTLIVWSSYVSHLPVIIGQTLMGLHCTDIGTKAFWEELLVFNFLCKYSYESRPVQDLS